LRPSLSAFLTSDCRFRAAAEPGEAFGVFFRFDAELTGAKQDFRPQQEK